MARTDDRGGMAVLAPGQTLEQDLNWLDASFPVDLSRDGRTILFWEVGVGGGARGSVYLRSTSGSPAVRLGDGVAVALSPDGKWALTRGPGPSPYLDLLPTGAGQVRRIEHPGTIYFSARWTPQSARVAVRAQETNRSPRIYLLDLDNGATQSNYAGGHGRRRDVDVVSGRRHGGCRVRPRCPSLSDGRRRGASRAGADRTATDCRLDRRRAARLRGSETRGPFAEFSRSIP